MLIHERPDSYSSGGFGGVNSAEVILSREGTNVSGLRRVGPEPRSDEDKREGGGGGDAG